MPKVIALDWDHRILRLVIANRQANRVTVDEVQCIPLTPSENEEADDAAESGASGPQAERAAQRLVEVLSEPRFRGAEVLATVRRSDVELRLFSLPSVPVEELPDIVRMQAINEFSEISDDWPVDFLTLETTSDQTSVLAATTSPRRLAEYTQLLQRADLRAKSLVLRPTATALLVNRLDAASRQAVEIVLEDLGQELEVSVLRDGRPILIRTVQAPRSDSYDRAAFLAQEAKRTTLAARNQLHGDDVQGVVLFGDQQGSEQLSQQLQQRLQLPVKLLDPLQAVQLARTIPPDELRQRGQLAAAIGLLVGKTSDDAPLIDFLNPRRFVPPTSKRNMILAASGALAALLVIGLGLLYWRLRSLDHQALDLQRTIQNQQKLVEAAEQRLNEVGAIEQWQQGDVNWLAQLRDISAAVPGPEKARFIRWQADVLANGNGQLILEGVVDQQQTIGSIDQAIRGPQRRVRPAGGDFEDREPGYPWRFKQTVTIETQPARKTAG